ncbi:ribosomal protein S18-alanine N-acetyltransferase [Paenibacillus sp. CMAA1739]|uniref:ribosomal protein S18-alanine N-acetyltransferase n=1 Tax=Paenibacillus ottowii TaxID=2315729 RepID=UPI002731D12C|nr:MULTISPECIES: ribosomal protein S18-alanine N-acetyltransferase [Paenibacillus]MDP1509742.1 ribosomal protein S18-alanine N-acetyltransferase [Paenibacillus ottowii]MEC4567126.1 ribosomal protein S18-alanine N-acetyltransferase [Paenibacillus sp. CMAA1739]
MAKNIQRDEKLEFRLMQLDDIPDVLEIEHEAFTLPWTEEAFRNELTMNHFAKYMIMELNGRAIGYAGMWTIMDEAHITNIAVREAYRGRKFGDKLLDELMLTASYLGMERMTLEVRVTNRIAQGLYEKKGFKPAGVRKGYYSDNNEDAVIMWADLPAHGASGEQEGSVQEQ